MAIVVFSFFGFTCAEIGKRIPVIRNIGAAAIFATFIPSALVYYKVLPEPIIKMTTEFTKIVELPLPVHRVDHRRQHPEHGSQGADQGLPEDLHAARGRLDCGDDRGHAGRHRCSGSAPTTRSSTSSCRSWPAAWARARFRCRSAMQRSCIRIQGELFATVLPPVMLGSLTAILFSGMLNYRRQALSAADRRRPPAARRGRRDGSEPGGDHRATWMSRTSPPPASPPLRSTCLGVMCQRCSACRRRWRCCSSPCSSSSRRRCRRSCSRARSSSTSSSRTAVTYPLLFAIGVCAHAVGQAGGCVHASNARHDRRHGRDADGTRDSWSAACSRCIRSRPRS